MNPLYFLSVRFGLYFWLGRVLMAKEEAMLVQGKVTAALANTQFKVKLDNLNPLV